MELDTISYYHGVCIACIACIACVACIISIVIFCNIVRVTIIAPKNATISARDQTKWLIKKL